MNTIVCDAPTSDLADLFGPLIADWLNGQINGWNRPHYLPGQRIISSRAGSVWCISELLVPWTTNTPVTYETPFHVDCKWQPD